MTSTSQTFQELQSLRSELAHGRREPRSPEAWTPLWASASAESARPTADAEKAADRPPEGAAAESVRSERIAEFVNEVTTFIEEREKDFAANPAASVIGAFVVGLAVGWILRRRQGG